MTTLEQLNPSVNSLLALLLLEHGFTFQQVSQAIPDCSFTLLCRIALARQPFPLDLAGQIRDITGIDTATLISATGVWTPNVGPEQRVAVPPNPLLGDPILPFPSFPTQPLVFPPPPPPVPEVWVVGGGIGFGGNSGAQAVNRNTGLVVHHVTFTEVLSPFEIVYGAGELWVFGNLPYFVTATSWFSRIDPVAGTQISAADSLHFGFDGACFEPTTATFWACPAGGTTIYRYNPAAGSNPDASVALSVGPKNFSPRDIVVLDGLLYVTAVYSTGVPATPFEGRVFEIDPTAFSILRVSTGTDLGNCNGLAADGAGNLWATSRVGGGTIPVKISKVPVSSFVAATVPLIGDPGVLTDPVWIEYLHGSVWVSDQTAPNGRLFSVDAGGNVLQSRTFSAGSAVGHVISDGNFLWYADKAAGLLHMLDPANVSFSPFTVSVGGSPDGLVAVSA